MQPVETSCFTGPVAGIAAAGTGTYYLNAAYIMSNINRKAYHQVTRSGHMKSYAIGISVFNCKNASTTIYTAPNNYASENAVRAWHFARKARYEDAGYSLSDLGHGERLRFAFDATSVALDQTTATDFVKPQHLDNTVDERGEWDLSDVIITPPITGAAATSDAELTDTFKLFMCGDHVDVPGSGNLRYNYVGMLQSWTENRRGWGAPSDEEVMQPENPLAFARMSELSSLEITTEVGDEQQQGPPYSNVDDDDATSVFAEPVVSGQLESSFPNVTTNNDLIVCPGGLAKITVTNNDEASAYPYMAFQIVELN